MAITAPVERVMVLKKKTLSDIQYTRWPHVYLEGDGSSIIFYCIFSISSAHTVWLGQPLISFYGITGIDYI